MHIVIDIPKEVYKSIQDNEYFGISNSAMYNAIKNGTPYETVTEFADRCRECGREKVLDKIRAEIEEQVLESLSDGGDDWFTAEKVNECLEIIDKHKKESEDKK